MVAWNIKNFFIQLGRKTYDKYWGSPGLKVTKSDNNFFEQQDKYLLKQKKNTNHFESSFFKQVDKRKINLNYDCKMWSNFWVK